MRPENLVQYIVPLTFLAIWALTSLFNRDAQPLPPRNGDGRGPDPGGPRPVPQNRPNQGDERWNDLGPSAPGFDLAASDRNAPPRRLRSADEAVVVLEPEPRRGPSQPSARPGARRGPRGRSPKTQPARRDEPAVTRALSAEMSRLQAPLLEQAEALQKLSASTSPLSVQERPSSITSPNSASSASLSPSAAREKKGPILSLAQLREAIIVAEVLRPPLAIRRPLPVQRPSH